jgi:integrase
MATITRRKSGYQAEVRRKGFQTVSRMFESRKEAEAWARMYEAEMDRGIFVSRKEAESTTLAEALDRYEREITVSKKGAARERYRIKTWKKHPLAACYLASVRSTDVAQYRDARLARGASTSTVRLELTLLSHVFTIAIKEWGMESLRNPVAMIRLPSRPLGRERRVGHERECGTDELEAIIAASQSPQLPTILRLAVETAMRRSEVIRLAWSQINLAKRYLRKRGSIHGSRRCHIER